MYLLTNFITLLMSNKHFQLPSSEDTNAHAQLIPRGSIMNTLMKMAFD